MTALLFSTVSQAAEWRSGVTLGYGALSLLDATQGNLSATIPATVSAKATLDLALVFSERWQLRLEGGAQRFSFLSAMVTEGEPSSWLFDGRARLEYSTARTVWSLSAASSQQLQTRLLGMTAFTIGKANLNSATFGFSYVAIRTRLKALRIGGSATYFSPAPEATIPVASGYGGEGSLAVDLGNRVTIFSNYSMSRFQTALGLQNQMELMLGFRFAFSRRPPSMETGDL